MLSRFSITTTFAYQNTIYFLRFQTIYYLFLILFYYFCIMFLCFFLSIYFFGYFYPLFHSQKIIYIILHSKKRVPDATDFHSATSYPSLFFYNGFLYSAYYLFSHILWPCFHPVSFILSYICS